MGSNPTLSAITASVESPFVRSIWIARSEPPMTRRMLIMDGFGWGFGLWLFGYLLGVALFFVVPVALIGWVITPVAVLVTAWVLLTRVRVVSIRAQAVVGLVWAMIAVVLDYVFIVRLMAPADGYYRPDVYLYYALTLAMPPAIGWWKRRGSM